MAPKAAPAGHIGRVVGIQTLMRYLELRGLDTATIGRAAGLEGMELEKPEQRIPGGVAREAWRLAAEATGDEAIGIHAAAARPRDVADVLDYACRASPTLGDALGQLVRYARMFHDRVNLRLVPESDGASLTAAASESQHVNRYQVELFCADVLRSARDDCDPGVAPVAVRFTHPAPARLDEHRRFFRCPLHFEQPVNSLQMAKADLGRPMRAADPTLAALLGRQLDKLVESLPVDESVSARARLVVKDDLVSASVSADRVARQMAMSVRTLARRLEAEGTSFRRLVDSVRREAAIRHLRDPRMELMEIAFVLGYSESSAFHRSFRRWTGRTPVEFRRQALG